MTYEEFIESLKEPIDGKCNFNTEVARLAVFSYSVATIVSELSKENEELKNRLVKLEDYIVEKLHEK